jgi:putative SOS response-associated peptidase YedK
MASHLKRGLNDAWRQLSDLKPKELLERRYERLQSYGRFNDTKADARCFVFASRWLASDTVPQAFQTGFAIRRGIERRC